MNKWNNLALAVLSCWLGTAAQASPATPAGEQSMPAPTTTTTTTTTTPAPATGTKGQEGTAIQAPAKAQWQKFTSLMGRFEVVLPASPDYYEQDIAMPGMDLKVIVGIYVSVANADEAYLTAFSVYPAEVDVSNPERNLEGALNGQVQSDAHSKLISAEYSKFQTYPAVDFVIKLSGDIYRRGRLIMVGSVLYQLVYVYQGDAYHEKDYKGFISSFTLLSE